MSNIYYSPEEFGLTVVKDVEWRGESYEFCQTVLWRDQSGNFYAASDSGCCCPSPFEYFGEVSSLTPITSLADLLTHIKSASEIHYFNYDTTLAERAEIVQAYQTARRSA